MTKKLLPALLVLFVFAIAACSVAEGDATETAEAGGLDFGFLSSEATKEAERGEFDEQFLIDGATATAIAGGSDDRLPTAIAKSTATALDDNLTATAETIEWDLTSTAMAIEEDEETPASGERQSLQRGGTIISTPTPAPTPTQVVPATVPAPTDTVAPAVPTETPIPPSPTPQPVVSGPWITALQAVAVVESDQTGTVRNVVAHVASDAGQFDSGDVSGATPSPGAGYAAIWEIALSEGDELLLCTVWFNGSACSKTFSIEDGSVSGASVDSVEVFPIWRDTAEWNELLANNDISVLLVLKSSAGDGSPLMWQTSITVHGIPNGLGGGNFIWIPETGETSFTTY
jgi:hypothetical protein